LGVLTVFFFLPAFIGETRRVFVRHLLAAAAQGHLEETAPLRGRFPLLDAWAGIENKTRPS
jgi:hypothetical protein